MSKTWRFIRGRRAFVATLVASTGVLAVRVGMVPRALSDEQVERLALDPSAPAAEELDYDLSKSMGNRAAQQFDLGPIPVRWQKAFRINTVERNPRRGVEAWSLAVDGLVRESAGYDRSSLDTLGRATVAAPFQCVEGWGLKEVSWRGVPLARVLERAGPSDGRYVTFHTLGGVYTDSLTLNQALEPDVLLADELNGAPLPEHQGLPLRLVVPFMYGYKSVKWVNRIEVTSKRHVGFWQRRGWPIDPYV